MTLYILCGIIAAPIVLMAMLAFHSKAVRPHKTTMEQLVRLILWLARWLQAVGEAVDSGLHAYRDATTRTIAPHAERERMLRQMEEDRKAEERRLAEKARDELRRKGIEVCGAQQSFPNHLAAMLRLIR
jgi:hypothetical protein